MTTGRINQIAIVGEAEELADNESCYIGGLLSAEPDLAIITQLRVQHESRTASRRGPLPNLQADPQVFLERSASCSQDEPMNTF